MQTMVPEIAVCLSILTMLLGAWLAVLNLWPDAARITWAPLLHGGAGIASVLLVLTLLSQQHWTASSIVWDAVVLAISAAVLGLFVARGKRRLGPSAGMMITLHAVIGATGLALLVGWLLG